MKHPAVTLGDLIREGKLLWGNCNACCRERDIDPTEIPLDANVAVPQIGGHMRCSNCGSKQITTRPKLYAGGIRRLRVWRRLL